MQNCATEQYTEYLVPLRISGTRFPLFLFPKMEAFKDIAALLHQDQPVYSVDIIKVCDAHPNCTMKELAAICIQVIRKKQAFGPYYLCGWSAGGFVVYEMAAQLMEEGEEIGLLALLDSDVDRYSSFLFVKSPRLFLAYIGNRLSKYARNLLLGRFDKILTDALAFITPKPDKLSWLPTRAVLRILNRPTPKLFEINESSLDAACASYIPPPYAKGLVLFRAQDRGPEFDGNLTLGWDRCAKGAIDVHLVDGSHTDMLSESNVFCLTEKLTLYLDQTEGRIRESNMT